MEQIVLVVEDDLEISRFIRQLLEKEGFTCHACPDGGQASQTARQCKPDVIVLDLMLPGIDGLEICTQLRRQPELQASYILMLTAKGEELDRAVGLATGADDYVVKPFSPVEFVARIRALLRRRLREAGDHSIYRTGHFSLDLDNHTVHRCLGESLEVLELTPLEFKLFATFLSYLGRTWTRSQLIDKLWGEDFFGEDRVVDTQVARLRKKIEPDPANPVFIKTITGIGYKFDDTKI